jgi:hypothetical protein
MSACLALCPMQVPAGSANQNQSLNHQRIIRFQIENDRVSGTDDGHTYSLGLFVEWPSNRRTTSVSIHFESLTHRKEKSRVDLLGIDGRFEYQVWPGGRFAVSGGVAVNGDLGGQSLQNGLHNLLNEPGFNLDYPDTYVFGLTAGAGLDQRLAEFSGFRLTGSGHAKVASSAAPSRVQGGIYLGRQFLLGRSALLKLQAGLSVYSYFWLEEILKPYYDEGYGLDSRLRFRWRWLEINMFYFSNPYGIDQRIVGLGFGFIF